MPVSDLKTFGNYLFYISALIPWNSYPTNLLGDVNGSVEAVLDALETYKSQQIKLSVLHSGVGPVSENDVKMAAPFKGN